LTQFIQNSGKIRSKSSRKIQSYNAFLLAPADVAFKSNYIKTAQVLAQLSTLEKCERIPAQIAGAKRATSIAGRDVASLIDVP
jgi:hypothetical protein